MMSKPQEVQCGILSAGGAATMTPVVVIEYTGISKDMSKIFFSVYDNNGWNEPPQDKPIIFRHNYSFDLSNKKIIEENPSDILYPAPPSFS